MSIRSERIGEQIREELSRLLRDELGDPRVGLVSLTRVQVAPDLSTASVYWSPLQVDADEEAVERLRAGLESAAGFLRRRLAAELSLRRTPELLFRHDRSIEEGTRTLALLRELEREREEREERDGPGSPAGEERD